MGGAVHSEHKIQIMIHEAELEKNNNLFMDMDPYYRIKY